MAEQLYCKVSFNPFTATARKFSGMKVHTDTPANSIFDGPITSLLSVLCILVEVLSNAQAKKGKSFNHFKFGTSVGRFSSDGAASTAVKGLGNDKDEERRVFSGSEFQTNGAWH